MSANPQQVVERLNLQLPNLAAKKQLQAAKAPLQPDQLYLLQLMRWGYNKGLLEDAPQRPLYDLGNLLEGLEYRLDPEEVMSLLCKEGPDEGAPQAKWFDPHLLEKLDPEGAATYALQQLQALKESKDPVGLD